MEREKPFASGDPFHRLANALLAASLSPESVVLGCRWLSRVRLCSPLDRCLRYGNASRSSSTDQAFLWISP